MKRWECVLIPFHSRARIINSFCILYLSFASPFLQLSKKNWNSFLKPIKEFLWRNKLTKGRPWKWGKWASVAKPRMQGGLGIQDPVAQDLAVCAKLFCTLAQSEESWACMARDMIMKTTMKSRGGAWLNLDIQSRLLSPF